MAKTYINTVKYNIMAKFEIEGVVDKHDIVGAVFGQCEGLLGEQMDLRELQQGGKIGRIEITPETTMGLTSGTLIVPSSMDMVQTSMLAAAIEAVDKVGPYTAKFSTEKIEDTRNQKRAEIADRAKELLKKFMQEQIPQTNELANEIRGDVRASDVTDYGPDKVPAGPDIDKANDIIVVEGRADVINLLKNQITNVVGMDGAKIQQTVIDLCNAKETTAFVDGDRGGILNARRLSSFAKIDFIARAPDGKEVEELARKEIVMALRKKVPTEDFLAKEGGDSIEQKNTFEERPFRETRPRSFGGHNGFESRERSYSPRSYGPRSRGPPRARPSYGPRSYSSRDSEFEPRSNYGERRESSYGDRRPSFGDRGRFNDRGSYNSRPRGPGTGMRSYNAVPREFNSAPSFESAPTQQEQFVAPEERAAFLPVMQQLQGTLKAKLFDANMQEIAQTEVRDLVGKISETENVASVVFDGIITKRLVEEAAKKGVKTIVGIKKGKIETIPNAPKTVVIST